jgi:hypothetical protein
VAEALSAGVQKMAVDGDALDSDGRSGGLALFWHESVEVNLIEKNFCYIDVSTRLSSSNPWFRITFVYGEPRTENHGLPCAA